MPLYFFDVTGHRPVVDGRGDMLANLTQAKGSAVQVMAEILPMHRADVEAGRDVGVAIRDEHGEVVWTIQTVTSAPD